MGTASTKNQQQRTFRITDVLHDINALTDIVAPFLESGFNRKLSTKDIAGWVGINRFEVVAFAGYRLLNLLPSAATVFRCVSHSDFSHKAHCLVAWVVNLLFVRAY